MVGNVPGGKQPGWKLPGGNIPDTVLIELNDIKILQGE